MFPIHVRNLNPRHLMLGLRSSSLRVFLLSIVRSLRRCLVEEMKNENGKTRRMKKLCNWSTNEETTVGRSHFFDRFFFNLPRVFRSPFGLLKELAGIELLYKWRLENE